MGTVTPALRQAMQAAPQQEFRVIVRTDGSANPLADHCSAAGLQVHHVYALVPGLAVTGSGAALLRLAEEPGVRSIEPDQAMRAL